MAAEKGQSITSSSETRLSSHEAVGNSDKDKIDKFISHEEAECMRHFLEKLIHDIPLHL